MASQKPTQPPAGDFATFSKTLHDKVRKGGYATGDPFTVFADGTLPKFTRWVGGTGEFDGSGLRDVVNANALYADEVKNDLDEHKEIDKTRHAALAARVSALEAQGEPPFPIA